MNPTNIHVGCKVTLRRRELQQLFDALAGREYQIIGPTLGEGAIIYDELTSVDDLPAGWTDEQNSGLYRLKRRDDEALFGYVIGPQAWKQVLHPSRLRLWRASGGNGGFDLEAAPTEVPKYAFVGVRACELSAIAIQDRVFMHGSFVDPTYRDRREQSFIVAVNCGQAGGTCFCASMKAGPGVTTGFDLALTELIDPDRHDVLIEIGSELGAAVMQETECREAGQADIDRAAQIVAEVEAHMGRSLDTTDIKDLLYRNLEHPAWEQLASRCMACANCTMVCPTCFCTTVEDVTDLTGTEAERWRTWDSCFTTAFSYMYGGSVRQSTKARYRQWLTHKLATWIDQFGALGCVGCGRCITWCPVGIDITEAVQTIRRTDAAMLRRQEV